MDNRWHSNALRVEPAGTGISPSLSEHVNLLGAMLGDAVRDRAGSRMLDLVEELRLLCRDAASTGDEAPRERAAARIAGLSLDDIAWLLRAFTAFFRLVNQAEQCEIVRVNRDRARAGGVEHPPPDSIAETVTRLASAGRTVQDVLALLARLDIQPTLTAHPTEARRQAVLAKQRRVADLLDLRARSDLTPDEETSVTDALFTQIMLLTATREVRTSRPSVAEEVEEGLYFLEHAIWDAVPRIYEDVERACEAVFGAAPARVPPFLRYRSWMGGDRDGNPNVTADVTRWTLARHRERAAMLHLHELDALRDELSISADEADVPDELLRSIDADTSDLALGDGRLAPYRGEPYREKLTCMMARLEALRDAAREDAEAGGRPSAGPAPYDAARYRADLELVEHALQSTGFTRVARWGRLRRVQRLLDSFGLHLAALDIRQHSRVHEAAVAALLDASGLEHHYLSLDEEARLAVLDRALRSERALLADPAELPDATREALATFRVLREACDRHPDAVGSYVISMTHSVSDMLEPLLLAKEAGMWRITGDRVETALRLVPLYETIDDLREAASRVRALIRHPLYRAHLEACGDFQEVMLGYSDSNKDGGYWMANWALHTSQAGLGAVFRDEGIAFRLFHGRGGTVGRGGGRSNRAIRAMPSVVQNGRIRATEQGEVISFRYSLDAIAHRHLEQIVSAVLEGAADAETDHPADETARTRIMEGVAERGQEAYRHLIGRTGFWEWYQAATPIRHISQLPLASRPASRGQGEVDFDGLRAIPWVFAWTQARYVVPGWFGTGQALGVALARDDEREALRTMYARWPFFRTVLDDAQREMARARLEIGRDYARLAADGMAIHETIADEFARARDAVLAVTGQRALLDNEPVIQKSIALRNPYTDVLNLLQLELLRRHRALSHDDPERARVEADILRSLNGIAAAMQSTG